MYNAELKEAFINETYVNINTRQTVKNIFDMIEPYEEKWNADICTVDIDRAKSVVNKICGIKTKTNTIRLLFLHKYATWCINNNIPNASSSLLQIKDVNAEVMKNRMVSNPAHLQRYMDKVFSKESDGMSDLRIRCYFWMAYAGMYEDDAVRVRVSDVDLNNMSIKYNGNEYLFYREGFESLRQCATLKVFYRENKTRGVIAKFDRTDNDLLLRGYGLKGDQDPNCVDGKIINCTHRDLRGKARKNTSDKNDIVNMDLTYNHIWLSGIFYRIHELEIAGVNPDFTDVAVDRAGRINYNLKDRTYDAKIREIAREYEKDYNKWKMAFNL